MAKKSSIEKNNRRKRLVKVRRSSRPSSRDRER
jgi:hypothetical protein